MNLPFEGYLRRKDAYEAADAGLAFWRKNFGYFLLFFAIPFWIFAFAFRFLPGKWVYLSWVVIWYLKPFFDRFILHVISVKFFEPDAGIKRLLKGLGKSLWRGLFGDLLWRRFTPYRSATMPIRILEPNKKTKKYSERKKLLNKGGLGYGFILTFWGLTLEAALLFGELIFISTMASFAGVWLNISSSDFIIDSEIYFYALWCLNYILIETLYVCMGFGVYINSRIEVEGWDIEIIFKGFADKLKKKKIIGVLSILLFLLVPSSADANPSLSKDNGEVPLEILEEVLSSPDFGYEKDSWEIKEKYPWKPKEKITIISRNRNKFMQLLTYIMASGLRIIIVVLSVAAAVLLFILARRYYKKKKNTVLGIKPVASILHQTPEENPQELLEKAIALYNQSHTESANYSESAHCKLLRKAWGYCTAAAIISLKIYRNMVFPPNATENDCAKIADVKLDIKDEAQKFHALVKTWVNFAYAGKTPAGENFEEAAAFCKSLFSPSNGDSNG